MTLPTITPTIHVGPNVHFGEGVVIGPFVSIDANGAPITIGDRCVIGPGVRIGQQGFGYADNGRGWEPKAHPFGVIIEDDVTIGANTCIDRGSWRATHIRAGSKIDNLVHIAHNVIVGRECLIVALAEISGSVELGDRSYVAPSACIRERLSIGAGAVVGLGAVVTKDVPELVTVAGVPARILGPADGPPPPPIRKQ